MSSHPMKIQDGKINFRCKMDQCRHSCCGPFDGISDELKSIENRPFDEIALTDEDYRNICEAGYAHLTEEARSPINGKVYHKMALKEDGTCRAFVDGRCSIYTVSPTLCKAFPFYFDLFAGLCAIECEGFSDDNWVDLSATRSFIQNAKKMYRFWLDFYED